MQIILLGYKMWPNQVINISNKINHFRPQILCSLNAALQAKEGY